MAKIPEYYEMGDKNNITNERLLEILEDMYIKIAVALNKKIEFYERTTDGQITDTFLSNGDINLNSSTLKVEMLVDRTASTVTWKTL